MQPGIVGTSYVERDAIVFTATPPDVDKVPFEIHGWRTALPHRRSRRRLPASRRCASSPFPLDVLDVLNADRLFRHHAQLRQILQFETRLFAESPDLLVCAFAIPILL